MFVLHPSGSEATSGPQTSAHGLANKTCAENYEIPAVTKGKVNDLMYVLNDMFSFLNTAYALPV